jgi:hypothetical protein
VKLGSDNALFLSADSSRSDAPGMGTDGKMDPDEVHTLDVLGPTITIDFTRPPLAINGNKAESSAAFQGLVNDLGILPSQIQRIDVVVPFAARLSFMHVEFPDGAPVADGPNEGGQVWGGAGKLSIIGGPAVDEGAYQIAQNSISRERRIWSEQDRDMPIGGNERMRYRMPFIAPRLGYQVYGKHEKFRLESVTGGLTLGNLDFPITGSADLEFDDISPLIKDVELPSAPLQFNVGREGEFHFQASSRVKVNDEEVVASKYTIGGLVGVLGGVLTIVTAIMTIAAARKT